MTFTWTDDGLIATEALTTHGQTYTVQRGYDADDRLTSITYPDGRVVTRSYFDDDTLDAVTFAGNPIIDRTYDALNPFTQGA